MGHLKHLLFGIILSSSFGSAFADEYDPRPDVFDQLINALVPTLIVFLFSTKEFKEKDLKEEEDLERDSLDIEKQEIIRFKNSIIGKIRRVFIKIRRGLPVKIRRSFDDFLFLLSLFVLPSIVFHKNHERLATPLWISGLTGVIAGIVFIMIIINYIDWHTKGGTLSVIYLTLSPLVLDLCHIFSDICFLVYTRSIPKDNFTDAFIYIHAVTGVLGAIFLLGALICIFLSDLNCIPRKIRNFIDKVIEVIGAIFGKFLITITFLWTPIVQMLNMALLSGNDYYWTKLILALNMIYISRVLYYAAEKKFSDSEEAENFGLLNMIFFIRHKVNKHQKKQRY
ncbi:hypothetical protein RclHR1_19770001 [Rhizophagus clarus]|uniref:Uncharacterized protein n=1 Tax=Rhizophagus clarus TaxID=94130 RepID=A0A2Z6RI53_9GLOM|nr:hypothetical protein RclHR1_19770001 [Rhizophagus clarus]GET03537.1 hypothetical protein GLOIN_2v1471985 [Rhizophagus clarus]